MMGTPSSNPGGLDPDSLPNSPTYFAQKQQQEKRETPSPGTQMANQSFQDYLNSLDAQARMRKKQVVEWIQRSNQQAWDRENQAKADKDTRKLRFDTSTHLPSRPYQKQEPIYASADEPAADINPGGRDTSWASSRVQPELPDRNRANQGGHFGSRMDPPHQDRTGVEPDSRERRRPELESRERTRTEPSRAHWEGESRDRSRMEQGSRRERNWSSSSNPQGQGRVPVGDWGAGRQDHRYGMDGRARVATVSGSYPASSSQFRYPAPAQHVGGAPSRGGVRPPQGIAGVTQQSIDPANYPKAKFGKDYYVLDV